MVIGIVAGFVAVVLALLGIAYSISIYNQLVRLRRRCEQAKQNIEVLLKQRQDELSKLIDAAEEFMDHEEEVLSSLTEARERAARAETPTEHADADHAVRDALAGFRARFEAYPELRSQSNMLQFQARISDIENQVADRREVYNEAVTQYNTRIQQFPYIVLAGPLGFDPRELFTASADEVADVDVGQTFAES